MNTKVVCLAFGLLLLAGCTTPEAGVDTAEAGANKRECRPVSGGLGSRMRQSVCKTAEEWALADAEAKEREDIQDEFFRRVGENAAQSQAPAFDNPAGGF